MLVMVVPSNVRKMAFCENSTLKSLVSLACYDLLILLMLWSLFFVLMFFLLFFSYGCCLPCWFLSCLSFALANVETGVASVTVFGFDLEISDDVSLVLYNVVRHPLHLVIVVVFVSSLMRCLKMMKKKILMLSCSMCCLMLSGTTSMLSTSCD